MNRLFVLLIILSLSACENQVAKVSEESPALAGASYDEAKQVAEKTQITGESTPPAQDLKIAQKTIVDTKEASKIIRNASVQFQVANLDSSYMRIANLLAAYDAYFGSENSATCAYQIEDRLVIRVPAPAFNRLIAQIMNESVYTNYKNVSADDVTDQFVDIEARLKTKREVELRYMALLRQSGKITDILEVEEKLRTLREEIEAAEGRLKLLKDQVAYSTISLTIYQKLDYKPEPQVGFISNLAEAFVRGWRSLINLVLILVRVWPFVLLWGIFMAFVYIKFIRKRV